MVTDIASPHTLEPSEGLISSEEVQLAFRNRGMPLEALRYDLTPTGLHYLLIHFDIPAVDHDGWRLSITGVHRPVELSMAEIRARSATTLPVTMECAGNGRGWLHPRPVSVPWMGEAVGTAHWTGTPVWPLLEERGIGKGIAEVLFKGADCGLQGGEDQVYARSLTVDEVRRPEVMLAYEMNGAPLEPQHGFPLRLLVPGWYGMTSVKWLRSIELLTEPYAGFQQAVAYRYQADREDPGRPVQRMRVRALMVPPGRPDFFSRRRHVDAGAVGIFGRAWSGEGSVERVEVAIDDGLWLPASLGPPVGDHAWRSWTFHWDASPGDHVLRCRATDSSGAVQPDHPPWNYQGMGNNAVQQVPVTVS